MVMTALVSFGGMSVCADDTLPSAQITASDLEEKAEVKAPSDSKADALLPRETLKSGILQSGSLVIELKDQKADAKTAFSVIQVADIKDGAYCLRAPFESCKVDLNNLKNTQDMERAAATFSEQLSKAKGQNVYTLTLDQNKKSQKQTLPVGVYLICAKDDADEAIAPSLVAIPSFEEEKKQMVYDLTVNPKLVPKKTQPSHSDTRAVPANKRAIHHMGDASMTETYFGASIALLLILLAVNLPFIQQKRKTDK